MFGLGTTELIIILVIVLILFGGSRISQLGFGLGKGIREFKKGLTAEEEKKNETEKPAKKDAAES